MADTVNVPILPGRGEVLKGTDNGACVLVVPAEPGLYFVVDLNAGFATRRNGGATKEFCAGLWPKMRWEGAKPGGMRQLRSFLNDIFDGIPKHDDLIVLNPSKF